MKAKLNQKVRCSWCEKDPIYIQYHDQEWGVPLKDDQLLFECLSLEGAQAGLSWLTILKKREAYRKAFHQFNIERVAKMGAKDIDRLVLNSEIVRHRLKIESVVSNAKAVRKIQKEFGSFSKYLWAFVDHQPQKNAWVRLRQVPTTTDVAVQLSRDLKKRGLRFVGPTIIYAFMQASGLVNDHLVSCFRYRKCLSVK